MKADRLRSQFEALEPLSPQNTLIVTAADSVDTIVRRVLQHPGCQNQ